MVNKSLQNNAKNNKRGEDMKAWHVKSNKNNEKQMTKGGIFAWNLWMKKNPLHKTCKQKVKREE